MDLAGAATSLEGSTAVLGEADTAVAVKPVTTRGDPATVAVAGALAGDPTTGKSSRDEMTGTDTCGDWETARSDLLGEPCRLAYSACSRYI